MMIANKIADMLSKQSDAIVGGPGPGAAPNPFSNPLGSSETTGALTSVLAQTAQTVGAQAGPSTPAGDNLADAETRLVSAEAQLASAIKGPSIPAIEHAAANVANARDEVDLATQELAVETAEARFASAQASNPPSIPAIERASSTLATEELALQNLRNTPDGQQAYLRRERREVQSLLTAELAKSAPNAALVAGHQSRLADIDAQISGIDALESVLEDPAVAAAIQTAWEGSNPNAADVPQGTPGSPKQEQAFLITRDNATNELSVLSQPPGTRDGISLSIPNDPNSTIVGFFHTHPNTGAEGYSADPSPLDLNAAAAIGAPGIVATHEGLIVFP